MFPLLPMGPMGTSGLPPHSTIESLGLMTNNVSHRSIILRFYDFLPPGNVLIWMFQLRQSTSTTATSMGPPSLDIRPRAFSSAAALQRPKVFTMFPQPFFTFQRTQYASARKSGGGGDSVTRASGAVVKARTHHKLSLRLFRDNKKGIRM